MNTENQPELMKERTRIGKILMFMGLSSVLITLVFVILVLVAGRHLSKVITGISASVSGTYKTTKLRNEHGGITIWLCLGALEFISLTFAACRNYCLNLNVWLKLTAHLRVLKIAY